MSITTVKSFLWIFFGTMFFYNPVCIAQNTGSNNELEGVPETAFYDYRGTHGVTSALGTAIINGDYSNPEFSVYFGLGYKKTILPILNANFSFNKFNLVYKDEFNNGYMSFDLNLEVLPLPHQRFSPFAYVGSGVHAPNYFKTIDAKVQGGLGLEYIVYEGLGFRVFGEYNHVFSDAVDGKIYGASDDVYWRIACGFNFYFGGKKTKAKLLEGVPTIIKSNPIPTN